MEEINYLRVVLAFLFVIGLIGALHFLLKKVDWQQRAYAGRKGNRLSVVESVTLDPKHRLVLVRRDNTEHLLLLGHPSDPVIEAGIECEAGKDEIGSNV